MKNLINIFIQILKNKYGIIFLLLFSILQASLIILFIKWITLKGILGVILFTFLSFLISELTLHILIKYKVTLSRFSSFLKYVYKGKAKKWFPSRNTFPDFHYFIYHPFCNFSPKPSKELNIENIEINSLGFRGKERQWKNSTKYRIYLSSDCLFFESHLESSDTFANMLEHDLNRKWRKETEIINGSCSHYTLLHCLNKFIIDLNKTSFDLVILCAGINDAVVFVHHKGSKVSPDYRNLYKSYSENFLTNEFKNLLVRLSKLIQLYKYLRKRRMLSSDNTVIELTPEYNSEENIRIAKKIFTTTYFENYLRAYISVCNTFNIPLMLVTPNYNPSDMKGPARSFIAYGIERMNAVINKLATKYTIPLLDLQKEFIADSSTIFNKWHYTKKGNELRAELISNFIIKHFPLPSRLEKNA